MNKFNIRMIWVLVTLALVLGVPVGASKVNDVFNLSTLGTANLVANDMNLTLHANTNCTAKLNTKNAASYNVTSTTKNGKLIINNDGTFIYTPNKNFVGLDSFNYRVYNGKSRSNIATVTLNVTNQIPSSANSSINTYKNTLNCGMLSGSDPDNDNLSFKIVTEPSYGVLTVDQNGRYTYIPNKDFSGVDSFTYMVNDGMADSNIAKVTVNITNEAPIAENASFNAHLSTPSREYTGYLNAKDPDNDKLSYHVLSQPNFGNLTVNEEGKYSYTPDSNFIGIDSFTYTANDGTTDSNIANITINLINQSPISKNITVHKFNDKSKSVYIGSLNATDDDKDSLTYTIVNKPMYGNVLLEPDSGEFVYIPNLFFRGSDSFTYVANDGITESNFATFTIKIE